MKKATQDVFLTRVFDAPRELVFAAWIDPQQLVKWFAPGDCSISYKYADIRPGGSYHSCIDDPVHGQCWCKGTYQEISFPDKIVFTMEMTNAEGQDMESGNTGKAEQWPAKTIVTINFSDNRGKTHVSLHQTVSASLAQKTGALPSWFLMLDKLDSILQPSNQIS